MRFPKIEANKPEAHNRKFRRGLAAIARTKLTGKQRFARVSDLIGRPVQRGLHAEHNRMVVEFIGAL